MTGAAANDRRKNIKKQDVRFQHWYHCSAAASSVAISDNMS